MSQKAERAEQSGKLVALACGAALGLYLVLFFTADAGRASSLLMATVPDRVLWAAVGDEFGRAGLLDRAFVLAAVAAVLAAAGSCGWLTLCGMGCARQLTRLEQFVFAVGVGLSELSLLTLAGGLVGGLDYLWIVVLPIIALAGWTAWRRGGDESRGADADDENPTGEPAAAVPAGPPRAAPSAGGRFKFRLAAGAASSPSQLPARPWWWLGLGLAVPLVATILLAGMLPPWEFDVREYHLQVPKEWYLGGRIGFLPHNVYGNMPLGAEMFPLLGMAWVSPLADWWWGAIVGKTVMAAFAPLTALGLYTAGRRFVSPIAGLIAALVYLSTPWVVFVSVTGLNEAVIGCYLWLAVYALWLWRTRGPLDTRSAGEAAARGRRVPGTSPVAARDGLWPWVALAGFFAGSAAGCKYTSVILIVFPLAVWCLVPRERWDWRPVAVFLLAAACSSGLWYGKNLVLAGNPVYPLVFGGETRTPEKTAQWNRAHQVPRNEQGQRYSAGQAAESIALLGWRSRWLSPLLVPLAALALVRRDTRRQAAVLAALLGAGLLAWWLTTHRVDRFLVPFLPLSAFLAGIGGVWSSRWRWQQFAAVLLVCGALYNGCYLLSAGAFDSRWLVSLHELRSDVPAEPGGASRVSPVHRYLNGAVPPGQCVLLVGDAQPFDLEVGVLYNTCFDDCIFEQLLRGRTRAQRRANLREQRVSHVYVDWAEIARYRRPGNYGFTEFVTQQLVWEELVRDQGLLRKVPVEPGSPTGELFEVLEN